MNTVFELADKLENTYSGDLFLGHLAWYAIGETTKVQHSDFEKALANAGVDFVKLPPAPRAVDIFKRGCTAAQIKKVEVTPEIHAELAALGHATDARYFNYLFRNAGQDSDYVYRILVREEVDSAGHEIGFNEVAKLRFTRSTSVITPYLWGHTVLTNEIEILNDVRRFFSDNNDTLTPYAIREFVRKALEGALHAVKVRPSGGVYFVQQAFAQQVEGLEQAITSVGGSFHTLPLLDDAKQREMLRTAFESEAADEINTFVGELMDITMGGKTITPERYVEFKVSYDDLDRKLSEYANLLDDALELSNSRLDVMHAMIVELPNYVDHGD
jgi:uncharacterized protein DUF6744